MDVTAPLQVIGVVRTAHLEPVTTPIQAGLNRAEHGTIEIDDRYREGLDGLAESGDPPPLRQVPFLLRAQQREKGIFATRGPRRINPIGLSLIRLLDVAGLTVRFAGVDLVDGTPVVDLKPYVTRFDQPAGDPRCGWFDHVTISEGITPAQLTPPKPPA